MNVISTLGSPQKDLVLVGGTVRQSDGAIVGEDAVEFISRYKADFAYRGQRIDEDGAILDFDAREVQRLPGDVKKRPDENLETTV